MEESIKKSILATVTLSGTIIGVGIFSLPYITTKVGILVTLLYFLLLGSIVIFIHYLFGEVALKTPDFLRLPGYAQIHLGKWGKRTALVSNILGLFGAILAYIIIGGEFLGNLLSPIFGGNNFLYTVLYFFLGAVLIFLGIKIISQIEFWGLVLFLLVLFFIFFRGFPFFRIENLFIATGGLKDFFLPYGPILFSLWGASLIPETEELLGKHKKMIRKIIPVSIIIPAIIYLFFIFLVVGISGFNTSSEAIFGLKKSLGSGIIGLAFFFGVLTTFTSFIAIGLTLKKVFLYDLKISANLSWFLTCFVPLFLFLLGLKDFIKVIGLVGGVMLGIDGVLILLISRKLALTGVEGVKYNKVRFLFYPLILIFITGIIYEIIYFLK